MSLELQALPAETSREVALRFGEGRLRGWEILGGPRGTREKTARGALLQLLLYQEAGDTDAAWKLLNWKVPQTGETLALELATALLVHYEELALLFDPESSDSPIAQSWRAGYRLAVFGSHSATQRELDDAAKVHGLGYFVDWEESPAGTRLRIVRWDTGEVLAHEESPHSSFWWRNCTAEIKAQLDDEEREIDAEAGRPWGEPLEEPTPEAVALIDAVLAGDTDTEAEPNALIETPAGPAGEPRGEAEGEDPVDAADPEGREAEGGKDPGSVTAPGVEPSALAQAEAAARATLAQAQDEIETEERQRLVDELVRLGGVDEDEIEQLLRWPSRKLEQLRAEKAIEFCARVGAHAPALLDAGGTICGTCSTRKPKHDHRAGGLAWAKPTEPTDAGAA